MNHACVVPNPVLYTYSNKRNTAIMGFIPLILFNPSFNLRSTLSIIINLHQQHFQLIVFPVNSNCVSHFENHSSTLITSQSWGNSTNLPMGSLSVEASICSEFYSPSYQSYLFLEAPFLSHNSTWPIQVLRNFTVPCICIMKCIDNTSRLDARQRAETTRKSKTFRAAR